MQSHLQSLTLLRFKHRESNDSIHYISKGTAFPLKSETGLSLLLLPPLAAVVLLVLDEMAYMVTQKTSTENSSS